MKQLFTFVILLFLGFQAYSQLKVGIDTTRKYPITPPTIRPTSENHLAETEKKNQDNMPVKKTSGNMPTMAVDTTSRMPNSMKRKEN